MRALVSVDWDYFAPITNRLVGEFPPEKLRDELTGVGLTITEGQTQVVAVEDHRHLWDLAKGMATFDLVLSIDQHHDLYYRPIRAAHSNGVGEVLVTCANWWVPLVERDQKAEHVWIYGRWQEMRSGSNPWGYVEDGYLRGVQEKVQAETWDVYKCREHKPMDVALLFFCRSDPWSNEECDELYADMCRSFGVEPVLEPHSDKRLSLRRG